MTKPMTEKQRKAKTERDRVRRNVNKELDLMRDLRALFKVPWNGSVLAAASSLVDSAAVRRQQLTAIDAIVSPSFAWEGHEDVPAKVKRLSLAYSDAVCNRMSKEDGARLRNMNAALDADRVETQPKLAQLEEITKLVGVYPSTEPVKAVASMVQLVQRLRHALEIWGSTDDAVVRQAADCMDVIKQVRKALNTPTGEDLVDHAKRVFSSAISCGRPRSDALQFGDLVWIVAGCPGRGTPDPDHHLIHGVVTQVEYVSSENHNPSDPRPATVHVAYVEDGGDYADEAPRDQVFRTRAEAAAYVLREVTARGSALAAVREKWLGILREGDVHE